MDRGACLALPDHFGLTGGSTKAAAGRDRAPWRAISSMRSLGRNVGIYVDIRGITNSSIAEPIFRTIAKALVLKSSSETVMILCYCHEVSGRPLLCFMHYSASSISALRSESFRIPTCAYSGYAGDEDVS